TWLESCLIPILRPGEWVILDNATFHHGGRIVQLIQAKGVQVVYLPPYSPDLNRIEKCWAWLKGRIRKQRRSALVCVKQWRQSSRKPRPNSCGDSYRSPKFGKCYATA
ncbi:transposase, partial [Trichocoleus sp. FACHB-46]|nr:transposase [Trichocoleus sp. FACHB-46]